MRTKVLLFSILILGCNSTGYFTHSVRLEETPKNIVLLIGDGMGLTQISSAIYASSTRLAIEQFPVIGFHKTYSSNDLITDSGAGATAFACGVKTFNSAIGLRKDSSVCKTILEEAEERGLATGLIATSTLVHATPASFAAHQTNRIYYEEIAADFVNLEIDLMIGGGQQYFENRETDKRNLVRELKDRGYQIESYQNKAITDFAISSKSNLVYFSADKHPGTVSTGRNYLPYAAKLGVKFLEKKNEAGFFLMIEGSQIDWACHAGDGKLVIKEMLDFDRAISEVLSFAKARGNTLVIVTADHETGGMAIQEDSTTKRIIAEFTTNGHTAAMVPVFAFGPGAELFSGIYENYELYHKMREAMGWKKMPD
jgi:alkaline phosphatase